MANLCHCVSVCQFILGWVVTFLWFWAILFFNDFVWFSYEIWSTGSALMKWYVLLCGFLHIFSRYLSFFCFLHCLRLWFGYGSVMTWCAFTRFVSVLEILSVCSELTLFCVILCVSVCFWEEVVFPRSLSLILNISRQFIVDVSSPSRSMHAVGYPKPSICCTPIAYNNCTYVISQVTVQPINSFTPPAHMLIILSYFTVSGVLCIV